MRKSIHMGFLSDLCSYICSSVSKTWTMVDPVVEIKCGKLIFRLSNDLFAKSKLSAAAIFLDFSSCCLE